MKELSPIINGIIKYGLDSNVKVVDKEGDLEELLVKLYSLYFTIEDRSDPNDYPEVTTVKSERVIQNVQSNFKDFGFYHVVIDPHVITYPENNALGDAVDDLSDIIRDLLEVAARAEHNSEDDAIMYFKVMFHGHTKDHVIGLLGYLENKRE